MPRPKFWAAIAAALAVTMGMSLTAPTDARADRCNPDEMAGFVYKAVTGEDYEPVFGEDQGPFCEVMKTVVYPAIGCDPATQSLQACVLTQPARALAILNMPLRRVREILSGSGCTPSSCGPPPCTACEQ